METRKLKQVDILNLSAPFCEKYNVKLNRNDLSQYVNGKVEPGQFKLFILAQALNVSEAWLMGLDVPMKRAETVNPKQQDLKLNEEQENALNLYSQLDIVDRAEIRGMMKQMLRSDKYSDKSNSKLA